MIKPVRAEGTHWLCKAAQQFAIIEPRAPMKVTDTWELPDSKKPAEPAPAFCIQSETENATFTVNSWEGLILQRWGPRLCHVLDGGGLENPALPGLDPSGSGASLGHHAAVWERQRVSVCIRGAFPTWLLHREHWGLCWEGRLAQVHQIRLPPPLLSLSTVHPAHSVRQP